MASGALPARGGALPLLGLTALGVSVVLLSSAWPVTKLAVIVGAAPLWFALGRAALSALIAFVLVAAMRRLHLPRRQDLPAVFSVGLLQLAAFFALAHVALLYVPAGRTAILSNVTTIWVAPLSIVVLGERISPRRWIASAIGIAGIVVLIGPWAIPWSAPGVLLGHVFLLGAGFGFSIAIVTVRRFPPASPMLDLIPWCFGLATLALLPLVLAEGGGVGAWPMPARWAMAYIGLAGPIGTWCVMEAAAALPAMVASVGFLATPAIGLLLSALWLHEAVDADLLIGSALILGGVGWAVWPVRRRAGAPP